MGVAAKNCTAAVSRMERDRALTVARGPPARMKARMYFVWWTTGGWHNRSLRPPGAAQQPSSRHYHAVMRRGPLPDAGRVRAVAGGL